MSDSITGLIRTWVPIGVGAVLSWLLTLGVELDADSQNNLIVGMTALVIAIYYTVVFVLSKRWPVLGVLLGSKKQPSYGNEQKLVVKVDSNAVASEVLRRMAAEDWKGSV